MAQNPNITDLDPNQVIIRTYDPTSDGVRMVFANETQFDISTSSADGDSVVAVNQSLSNKVSITNSSTGVILAPFATPGMSQFQLYCNTTSTLVGPQAVTLQVSPSDTDNVWVSTTLTVTPSTTASTAITALSLGIADASNTISPGVNWATGYSFSYNFEVPITGWNSI